MTTESTPRPRRIVLNKDLIWPVAIAVALALVMVVNAIYVYVAVTGADEVDASYVQGER